ncbi:MAG: SURF1 family protein [Pseudomonadales bacterium]|nr:SURF1 family protein [Pseudomonadales bacterium]
MSLGIWQVNRAEKKEQQQHEIKKRTEQPPVSLNQTPSPDALPYTKATVTGKYRESEQFLLDNIIQSGKPGFYVITPFEIAGTGDIVLVNRGWIAQKRTRLDLPETTINLSNQTLHGTLAKPRSKPVILGNIDSPISDTPPLWYYMDTEHFEKTVGYNVLPLVLRLASSSNTNANTLPDSSLIRQWPQFEAKTGMHIGYAIQWFVFALFVLIAFFGTSVKKNTTGSEHD